MPRQLPCAAALATSLLGCILPDYVGNGEGQGGRGGQGGEASGPSTGTSGGLGGGGEGGGSGGAGGCPSAPFATQIGDGGVTVLIRQAAPLPQGRVAVLGSYEGTGSITIGRALPPIDGDKRSFVAVFDRAGQPVWALAFGGVGWDANAIASRSDGGVVLAMSGDGETTGPTQTSRTTVNGGGLLFALDQGGNLQWNVAVDGDGAQAISAVAVMPNDEVVVTGRSTDELQVEGLPAATSANQSPFFARFSVGGTAKSQILWPVQGSGAGQGIVTSGADTIFVAGQYQGAFDPPIPSINMASQSEGFLIELAIDQGSDLESVPRALQFGSDARADVVSHLTLIDDDLVVEGATGAGPGNGPFVFGGSQLSTLAQGLPGRYVARTPLRDFELATIAYAQSDSTDPFELTVASVSRTGNGNTLVALSAQGGATATLLGDLNTFNSSTSFVELAPDSSFENSRSLADDANLSALFSECGHFAYGNFSGHLGWYGTDLDVTGDAGVVAFHPNVLTVP